MLPVLFRVGPIPVGTHDFFVVMGVITAIGVLVWQSRGRPSDPRLPILVAAGLLTGALFAKLGTGWQYLVRADDATLLGLWLHGGQSVLGGLAGAYAGILVTKRIIGYRESTGDWFAPAVAAGLAVGRFGCFLTEQIGSPTSLPWGITLSADTVAAMPYCPDCQAGVAMHPSFLYEILFHGVMFVWLIRGRDRFPEAGMSFKVYLLAYGLFRFLVEFVRENPAMAGALSGSQVFLMVTLPLLGWAVARGMRPRVPVPA